MLIPQTVTLSQLRALVAVVDEGGIARAAARIGVAPSAVSQHLSLLERAVGLSLLDRRRGPISAQPTAAAQILVAHAREVLRRLDVFGADAARLRNEQLGRLRLGCFMSVGARILPPLLAAIGARHREVEIELVERDVDEELIAGVLECSLELAFVTLPVQDDRLLCEELLVDPHVLLAPRDHRLARRGGSPTVEQLAALPLIGFRNDPTEERRLGGVLRAHGLSPRVVVRTDNNLAIPELVARGLGLAVVPRLTLPAGFTDPRLAVVAVSPDIIPPRRIGMCRHGERTLGPVASIVRETAREVCEELAADVAA